MPAARDPQRASHFPAIEKKHGQPMSYWFGVMAELEARKYPEQMAYLQENHGFSRAHANALIMHSRGSTSSRRFIPGSAAPACRQGGTALTISCITTWIFSTRWV